MGKRAIIDVGSNSVRLIIYRIKGDSTFEVIDEAKETIRLGDYLTEDNYLAESGIEILMDVLDEFIAICKEYEAEGIYVTATEAVRKSNNRDDVCSRVEAALGLKINILSGVEEARYGYLAVKNSMEEKDAVLLDLGGSSMEITLMKHGEFVETISLPLGCIPLTRIFNNIETEDEKIKLNTFINNTLDEISWLTKDNKMNVIGIGGISKYIGRVSKGKKDYPKELLHNYSMTIDEIYKIYSDFLELPMNKRSKVKGLSKKRAEIFAAPLGAVLSILEYLNSEKFIISAVGLREGMIYEKIECGNEE